METILKHFESFIKRSMLPSSVLLVVIFFFTFKDETTRTFLMNFNMFDANNLYLSMTFGFILLISLSYGMSILTQILFENNMKKYFNSWLFYKRENQMLNALRKEVILQLESETKKLTNIEYTDYFLYQVIGRKLQFLKYPTPTKRYIDEIKSAGSIFIAMIISLLLQSIVHYNNPYYLLLGIILIFIIHFIAIEYLISKYRSRAIRIYTNYLIGDK